MKYVLSLLLLTVIAAGCNNNTKEDTGKKAGDHAAHEAKSGDNYCDSVNTGLIQPDTLKGSPHRSAMAMVNGTHVHIEYSSPGVKDRVIWGGLVAWDKVWVAGAHAATSVRFYKDVMIGNKKIAKGIYGFFVIPGKENWTVILNTRYDQHLTDEYDEKEDVVRVSIRPETNDMTQRLTYTVNNTGNNTGSIVLTWEKLKIVLPFKTTVE